MSKKAFDFAIVGGGVVGVNLGLVLRQRLPKASIVIIEKEKTLGEHASGRNSGVLHAGFYYTGDSLKAKLTYQGNQFLTDYCKTRGVPLNQCGKLVVAKDESELDGLNTLFERAERNGVPVEEVTEAQAKELEPLARTHHRALWSPATAAADPAEVMKAFAEDARKANIDVRTHTELFSSQQLSNGVQLNTSQGTIECEHMVNAAGLYADKVAKDLGYCQSMAILPFKGLYLYSDLPLKRLVYPVPDLRYPFLGVHFTVTYDGKAKIGPTAIPAFWREHYKGLDNFSLKEMIEIMLREADLFLRAGFDFRTLAMSELMKYYRPHMVKGAADLVPSATADRFTHYGKAGIRAQLIDTKAKTLVMDFMVETGEHSTHILNAVSPAWTCSRPFSEYVVDSMILKSNKGSVEL